MTDTRTVRARGPIASSAGVVLTVCGLTLREAARRRVLRALAGLTLVLLGLSGWGFAKLAGVEVDSGQLTSGEARLVASQLLNLVMFGLSMIAALGACMAVRFYVVQQDTKAHRWTLDMPVSALTLMFSAGAVTALRPQPLTALLIGTGLGAVGAGLIKIGKRYVDRWLGETTAC